MTSIFVNGAIAIEDVSIGGEHLGPVLGGSGFYAAIAASSYCPTRLIAQIGCDVTAADVERIAHGRPLTCELTRDAHRPCLRWVARYCDASASPQAVNVRLGALATARRSATVEVSPSVLLLTPENPAFQLRLVESLRPHRVVFVANDWWLRAWPEACVQLASRAHVLFANDAEAQQLSALGVARTMPTIVTSGARGVCIKVGNAEHRIPPPLDGRDRVVDPTGAGDALAGATVGMLIRTGASMSGAPLVEALGLTAPVVRTKLLTHGAAAFAAAMSSNLA